MKKKKKEKKKKEKKKKKKKKKLKSLNSLSPAGKTRQEFLGHGRLETSWSDWRSPGPGYGGKPLIHAGSVCDFCRCAFPGPL